MAESRVAADVMDLIEEHMLDGMTPTQIAHALNEAGIPTTMGRPAWNNSTVGRICKRLNEPIADYEDPAKARNEGVVPLQCSCGEPMRKISDLMHHTWEAHGRMPTREERTPKTKVTDRHHHDSGDGPCYACQEDE